MQEFINSLKGRVKKHELLSVFQDFQRRFGYIDLNLIEELIEKFDISAEKSTDNTIVGINKTIKEIYSYFKDYLNNYQFLEIVQSKK